METYENICLPWSEWEITRHLGNGGYGKVYEIERNTSGIQEKAALKIISRPKDSGEIDSYYDNGYDRASVVASYEKEIQDYVQEYQIMKEFQGQSNIVSCDDFAVVPHADGIGGDIFLRMELLTSLPQILRQRTLSEQEIIKLGKDISHALMLCESKNIIHRDVKPVNIMVSKFGDYKLGDFGVSKIMDHATYATMMGTPEYQAPEVVHMEKYGKTADIYSLGVTLYWLLNNRKMPFIGADERITPAIKNEAVERRYRGEQLPPPRDGSEELKRIVLKACAYHSQDRYGSAEDMYQALKRLGGGQTADSTVRPSLDSHTGGSGTDYQFDSGTIGKDSAYAGTAGQQNVDGKEYGGGQTVGNSWSASSETIGKPVGNEQRKTGNNSEENYTETIGVKQAYHKQQEKTSSITPENGKTDQSPKKKDEPGWVSFWYGILTVFLIWGVPDNIKLIENTPVFDGRNYMLIKAIIEAGLAAIIGVGFLLSIAYGKMYKKGKKAFRLLGISLIVVSILFCLGNVFEEFYLARLGHESTIGSIVVLLILCGLMVVIIMGIIDDLKSQ